MSKFRNFGKLFLGSILGQGIALALYPSIARLYSPEDFSKFGFIFSLTSIISVFATGQLHTAVMNPKSDEEAKGLIGLACSFVAVFSILSFIVLYFVDPSLSVVGIYLFFFSLFEIERFYLIRLKNYNLSALAQFFFRLSGNAGKLLPFFVSLNSMGLVLSELLALIMVVVHAFSNKIFHFSFDLKLLRKYISFPVFHSSTMGLNLLISDFPILFWITKYSADGIGYFVMAQKLLVVPAIVASQALQNSTVHQLLESKQPLKHFMKTIFLMLTVASLGVVSFHFVGVEVISTLLGPKWSPGGPLFMLLSFLFLSKFSSALIQAVFTLKNSTKLLFCIRLTQFGTLFFLNLASLDFYESLKFYVIIDVLFEILLLLTAISILKPPFTFRQMATETPGAN